MEHEKQNDDLGKVLAAQIAAALMHGCLHKNQKPYGIALDTPDFVRHVPARHSNPQNTLPQILTAAHRKGLRVVSIETLRAAEQPLAT